VCSAHTHTHTHTKCCVVVSSLTGQFEECFSIGYIENPKQCSKLNYTLQYAKSACILKINSIDFRIQWNSSFAVRPSSG